MKEIVVLSGKGGVGKTSITAALASVYKQMIICDCDVDAADLHLVLDPETWREEKFESSKKLSLDVDRCISCGLCFDLCQFDAIKKDANGHYSINPFQCEACLLCLRTCPAKAISAEQEYRNSIMYTHTRFGSFIHAKMAPGEENSGRLVARIRQDARKIAKEEQIDFIITDGAPGIGCPVISCLSNADHVLLIAEPSKSSLHDVSRLVSLVQTFDIPMSAVINKADLDLNFNHKLKEYFKDYSIPLLGEIAYDPEITAALIQGKTIPEYANEGEITKVIKQIAQELFVV